MIEKVLLEYIVINRKHPVSTGWWDKISITNKNVYIYVTTVNITLRKDLESAFSKVKLIDRREVLNDLLEIYNENSEIINEYEELKNKFLEFLNRKSVYLNIDK